MSDQSPERPMPETRVTADEAAEEILRWFLEVQDQTPRHREHVRAIIRRVLPPPTAEARAEAPHHKLSEEWRDEKARPQGGGPWATWHADRMAAELDRMHAETERLRAALAFYATDRNYDRTREMGKPPCRCGYGCDELPPAVESDGGDLAREALRPRSSE